MGSFVVERDNFRFELDQLTGAATLRPVGDEAPVWRGTVFPALHVQDSAGARSVLYATGAQAGASAGRLGVDLDLGRAHGHAEFTATPIGVELTELTLTIDDDLALVDLFFGLGPLEDGQHAVADPEYPEWPDWQSSAFCVPSARPAPPASFVRRWDLGQAVVALGLFGPALGSPYGAAFPRPTYSAGFGDDRGWLVAGVGEIVDGALTLDIRGTVGAMRWRYREDLWPVPADARRWTAPLRLAWAATAVVAFERYFSTFERDAPDAVSEAAVAAWNSWGDFRRRDYRLDDLAAAAQELAAGILVLDDGWETSISNGVADEVKLPRLKERLDAIRDGGMGVGFWQSVGWVDDPAAAGLTEEDLLLGADGRPRRANWALDPRDPTSHFALDPSSPRTRRFLEERTRSIIRTYRPSLIKLDFGYGLPGPDSAVSRNPALRGERMGHELYRVVRDAAKAEDPSVAIQLYGIHPLHAALADVVALDDMGDHGDRAEGEGHRHWSVWAALLGAHGAVVNGSSGYQWDQDGEVVLDTAVLGTPGAVLPLLDPAQPVAPRALARRRAINRWHRRSVRWRPLWLDSELGRSDRQPRVASWGRLEHGEALTALCLRAESAGGLDAASTAGIVHTGDWAVIAQDGDLRAGALAVIPISEGVLRIPRGAARVERWMGGVAESVQPERANGELILRASDAELDAGLEGWIVPGLAEPPE